MTREELPKCVSFRHYLLELTPNFETFDYEGRAVISLEVRQATRAIELNSLELVIRSASIVGHGEALAIDYLPDLQRVRLTSETTLEVGKCQLLIDFSGRHNDQMAGFYRSKYTDSQGTARYAVTTQFEATDARRAFPCGDEPALKATFEVVLNVPSDLTALSNMPVKTEKLDATTGLKRVHFETTPVMSTYLLAFFVGSVDWLEATAVMPSGREVRTRIYTPVGKREQGRFALDLATRVLSFFSEYFAIEYPLPKMDLIAIPDFAAGAMENWGLVTFRTRLILYQEGETSFRTKVRIAYIVCHELAHQWFGNLVTMEWWSDLWLNEGFATWVGWMAADHFFPEWRCWELFMTEEFDQALALDRLSSSHPITNQVARATEISEIFDSITYSKGASIIRMLVNAVGEGVFQTGLRSYLAKYQYGNARTSDLWEALSRASGRDIGRLMDSWTSQMGYPLVTVRRDERGVTLSQEKFADLEERERCADYQWVVPLNPIMGDRSEPTHCWLEGKSLHLEDRPLKLNSGSTGFYLTQYDDATLEELAETIRKQELTPIDRAEVVGTLYQLALYNYCSATRLLEFVDCYSEETEHLVWEAVAKNLKEVSGVWYDNPEITGHLSRKIQFLLRPVYQRLGWEPSPDEDPQTSQLRVLAIGTLGYHSDGDVLEEAARRFEAYRSGQLEALPKDLREHVFGMVGRHDADHARALRTLFQGTDSEELKCQLLSAMGRTNSHDLLDEALTWAFTSGEVRGQDALNVSLAASRGALREQNWRFIVDHWETLVKLYQASFLFGRIVGAAVQSIYHQEELLRVESFLKDKEEQVVEIASTIRQSLERARFNQRWRQRDTSNILDAVA
jgi:aminopeptidase N